jgi:rhamnose transport system permease protein
MRAPTFSSGFRWWHEVGLLVLLVGLLVGAGVADRAFLSRSVQLELSTHAWELALLALPMTLIVLTAGIDLSVGAMVALAAVALGLTYQAGWPLPLCVLTALLTGTAAGALNGLAVTALGVHPLIVTLATLAAYRGIAEGVSLARPISGFPDTFAFLGRGSLLGVPVPGLVFLAALAATGLLLWATPWGPSLYAIGHNPHACRSSGLAVDRIKGALYTLSGLAAATAAVLYVARRNTAKADIGTGLELDVITAVVLGGTSIFGGRGTLPGTLLGVLLIHELREFVAWRWNRDELVLVVTGVLLIASVLLQKALARRGQGCFKVLPPPLSTTGPGSPRSPAPHVRGASRYGGVAGRGPLPTAASQPAVRETAIFKQPWGGGSAPRKLGTAVVQCAPPQLPKPVKEAEPWVVETSSWVRCSWE